jgi:hypothetical protein
MNGIPDINIPVMTDDGILSKFISFYKIAEICADKSKARVFKRWKLKISIVWHSFKIFNIVRKQQVLLAKSISELMEMGNSQKILVEHGVTYLFREKSLDPNPKKTEEEIATEILTNSDTSGLPKN